MVTTRSPAATPPTISIQSWLRCPLQHYYAHVARVPLPVRPTQMYGNAIHHAIRVWHQHRMKGLPIEGKHAVAAYEEAWSSEGFHSLAHEERMRAHLGQVVPAHVRLGFSGFELQLADGTGDHAQAVHRALVGAIEQQLHAQADA